MLPARPIPGSLQAAPAGEPGTADDLDGVDRAAGDRAVDRSGGFAALVARGEIALVRGGLVGGCRVQRARDRSGGQHGRMNFGRLGPDSKG